MDEIQKKLQMQKEYLQSHYGFNVAYICVYGSQNYGLDVHTENYQSDLDMKAVIIPTLDQLIADSTPVSGVYETTWGICDVKDIRVFLDTLCKCNPSYIETLYTDYYISTPMFDEIRGLRREIVDSLPSFFFKAAFWMIMEKEKALCHPYPSTKDKIDKYGYDPKQLHHIARLKLMVDKLIPGQNEICLKNTPEETEALLQIKLEPIALEYAIMMSNSNVAAAREVVDAKINMYPNDFAIKGRLRNIVNSIIKENIVSEIVNHEYLPSYWFLWES